MVEALIAGAGPAGATAALILARAGVRGLLVDRATFPRDKLCGDTVNPGALVILRRLGLDSHVEDQGLRLDGMIVTCQAGARVQGTYRGCWGRAISRRDLDWWLVRSAVSAGAKFEEGVHVHEAIVSQDERGPQQVKRWASFEVGNDMCPFGYSPKTPCNGAGHHICRSWFPRKAIKTNPPCLCRNYKLSTVIKRAREMIR